MAGLRLRSNFIDYYDHRFAGSYQTDAPCFERMSRTALHRKDMFARLTELGLLTPAHGTVQALCSKYRASLIEQGYTPEHQSGLLGLMQLVVYTDPYAHAGEGKLLLPYDLALAEHPDAYASEFIPQNITGTGVSLRHLRIGRRQFWLRYTSQNDWRSNAGEVTIEWLCEEKPKTTAFASVSPEPLLAIDFITGPEQKLLAVDYNTAPQLRGTGMEDKITPQAVVDELVLWHDARHHATAITL